MYAHEENYSIHMILNECYYDVEDPMQSLEILDIQQELCEEENL